MKKEEKYWLSMLSEMGVFGEEDDLFKETSPVRQVVKAYNLDMSAREVELLELIAKVIGEKC